MNHSNHIVYELIFITHNNWISVTCSYYLLGTILQKHFISLQLCIWRYITVITIHNYTCPLHHQLHHTTVLQLQAWLICVGAGVYCGRAERRLINDLMMFYQKLERPVVNESDAIQLRFGLTLQQIMNVVGCYLLLVTECLLSPVSFSKLMKDGESNFVSKLNCKNEILCSINQFYVCRTRRIRSWWQMFGSIWWVSSWSPPPYPAYNYLL